MDNCPSIEYNCMYDINHMLNLIKHMTFTCINFLKSIIF